MEILTFDPDPLRHPPSSSVHAYSTTIHAQSNGVRSRSAYPSGRYGICRIKEHGPPSARNRRRVLSDVRSPDHPSTCLGMPSLDHPSRHRMQSLHMNCCHKVTHARCRISARCVVQTTHECSEVKRRNIFERSNDIRPDVS